MSPLSHSATSWLQSNKRQFDPSSVLGTKPADGRYCRPIWSVKNGDKSRRGHDGGDLRTVVWGSKSCGKLPSRRLWPWWLWWWPLLAFLLLSLLLDKNVTTSMPPTTQEAAPMIWKNFIVNEVLLLQYNIIKEWGYYYTHVFFAWHETSWAFFVRSWNVWAVTPRSFRRAGYGPLWNFNYPFWTK